MHLTTLEWIGLIYVVLILLAIAIGMTAGKETKREDRHGIPPHKNFPE